MTKKIIFEIIFLVILIYPGISIFNLEESFVGTNSPGSVKSILSNYQISIWLTWIVMVSIAVYYKWISENNLFFYLTLIFLFISISIFGFYLQRMTDTFEIETNFRDSYTFGFLTALQNFVVAAFLTGFLQAEVWWFTKKWHRR